MKTAYENSNNSLPEDNLRKHICNVCGSQLPWGDEHGYIERPAGEPLNYDVQFIICSDDCRKEAREPFIKWLSSQEGWTKKQAIENYDKYVARDW